MASSLTAATPSTMLTGGLGSWGSVHLLVTGGMGSDTTTAPSATLLVVSEVLRTTRSVSSILRTYRRVSPIERASREVAKR